jgi:hypothetical protein
MAILSTAGRIFYGLAIAQTGLQTIYYHDFPYWLVPAKHSAIPGLDVIAYISGILLLLAGVCIVFEKKIRPISLLLGAQLLLIFCFWYIPHQFIFTSNYLKLLTWDTCLKELAIASGAFIVAGCFSEKNEHGLIRLLARLIPSGPILFSITMITFGTLHCLYANGVAGYAPAWLPYPVFWIYITGIALIGSGLAIMFKVKPHLIATLLGSMIFSWFIIVHIPKVLTAPVVYFGGELTSAFLALAYSGTAFVIAGNAKK